MNPQQPLLLNVAQDPMMMELIGLCFARLRALSRPGALISVDTAADLLETSPGTVRSWLQRGKLRYVVPHLLLRDDVERFRQRVPSRRIPPHLRHTKASSATE